MPYLNINGKITETSNAVLQADNGAFRYGYGLFETMLVRNGKIQLADLHSERLFAGIKQLYLDAPVQLKPHQLEEQVLKTVIKNQLQALCRVRLQVFAGGGGLFSNEASKTGFVIECFPLDEAITQLNENGLVAGIAHGVNKSADSLSHIKSCNALVYAIAARQAKEEKWNDALIRNTAGHIIESTIANVFWVADGNIYTPPLTEGCIDGVMRRHIMSKISVKEHILNEDVLVEADEVFLTNAIRGVKWIGAIGDKKYTNQVLKSLQ